MGVTSPLYTVYGQPTLNCWFVSCVPQRSTMLRTVISRALPRLSQPAVCHFSAAAIPAPNTQPEVHYNKVTTVASLLPVLRLSWTLVSCKTNKCLLMQNCSSVELLVTAVFVLICDFMSGNVQRAEVQDPDSLTLIHFLL